MKINIKRDRAMEMKFFKGSFLIASAFACFSLTPEKVEYYKLTVNTPAGLGMVSNINFIILIDELYDLVYIQGCQRIST